MLNRPFPCTVRRVTRYVMASLCLLTAWAGPYATAAEDAQHATTVEAARLNDKQLKVSVRITRTAPGGEALTLSHPQVIVAHGQRAVFTIGKPRGEAKAVRALRAQGGEAEGDGAAGDGVPSGEIEDDIESGVRVDLISVKGKDEVLVVSSVIEGGATVWAEAKTVPLGGASKP